MLAQSPTFTEFCGCAVFRVVVGRPQNLVPHGHIGAAVVWRRLQANPFLVACFLVFSFDNQDFTVSSRTVVVVDARCTCTPRTLACLGIRVVEYVVQTVVRLACTQQDVAVWQFLALGLVAVGTRTYVGSSQKPPRPCSTEVVGIYNVVFQVATVRCPKRSIYTIVVSDLYITALVQLARTYEVIDSVAWQESHDFVLDVYRRGPCPCPVAVRLAPQD